MSNDTDTDDQTPPQGDNLKSLREAAERGKAAQTEAARLQKENLFLRAGIDPEGTRLNKLLFTTFDGADVAALKAEARELGIKLPEDATPPPADNSDNLAGIQRARQSLNTDTGTPAGGLPQTTPHPIDGALAAFHASVDQGVPREDAAAVALNAVMAAGAAGDKRVIFNPREWMENAHPAMPAGMR